MGRRESDVWRAGAPEAVQQARAALGSYREGRWTLDELIDWAERLEAAQPSDPWLRRVAQSLANPLLCREQAMAFIGDLLGSAG